MLEQAVIKIGNLSSSHLQLTDTSVSRMHAVIERIGNKVSIIDLGSTAGTLVNGEKINKAILKSGDTLVIGKLCIEVEFSALGAEEGKSTPATASTSNALAPAAAVVPPPVPSNHNTPLMSTMATPALEPAFEQPSAERSIEVTAMLGDSVVGVKHVMNPKGGKIKPLSYGFLGFGTLLLLISALAFGSGVSTAADNKARLHEHVGAKKVGHDFRPLRLSSAFDWMALGGLAGGLLCMTMGMLRIREEKVAPSFRIGNAAGVDFPTEESPQADFSLVAPLDDGFVLNFSESWKGEVLQGGQTCSLADHVAKGGARPSAKVPGALELDMHAGTEVRIHAGSQRFIVRSVAKPRRQATPLLASFDSRILSYVAATAVIVGGFILMLDSLHEDDKRLYSDLFANQDRYPMIQTMAFEDPINEQPELDNSNTDPGGTGTQMAEVEGKMGDKNESQAEGQFEIKNRDTDPRAGKERTLRAARSAGILGVLTSHEGGAFSDMFSSNPFDSGLDDRDVYGGLTGSEVAAASGGWGFAVRGMGPGGGCLGCDTWGTIGAGRIAIIGHSTSTGTEYVAGTGKGPMRAHKASGPILKIGDVSKTGGIDADIIRRRIRQRLKRIRHCYERELVVNGDLQGTVTTRFQISPAGKVQGIAASGMGNKNVESCVAAVIKSIQFPKPLDGGYVNVTRYPFTFRPAGG